MCNPSVIVSKNYIQILTQRGKFFGISRSTILRPIPANPIKNPFIVARKAPPLVRLPESKLIDDIIS